MKYERNYTIEKNLTKDNNHKKLSGVCGGIAKHYGLPRFGVRLVTVVSFITFPVVVGVAYIVAAVLIPEAKY